MRGMTGREVVDKVPNLRVEALGYKVRANSEMGDRYL